MNRNRKLVAFVAALLVVVSVLSSIFTTTISADASKYYGSSSFEQVGNDSFYYDRTKYFDSSAMQKLPAEIGLNDEISLIIELPGNTVLDYYRGEKTDSDFSYYFTTSTDAAKATEEIKKDIESKLAMLDDAGINYAKGVEYTTLLRGFEITVLGSEFEKVCQTLGNKAAVHIGNTYETAEAKDVKNEVSVDKNGIFDGSQIKYDGTGVVVAVLDTGLDYTHSAFSVGNFNSDGMRFDLAYVEEKVNAGLAADRYYPGVTGKDLYVNDKVPFAFDYADADPDVFPQKSNHGTHVAGIIAGKNDLLTGVAPNAQLAIMKVFSDKTDGAKSSWIIAALEDCVKLNVDVINMSLGQSCGFSDPEDELEEYVYSQIEELGLSLIVAAGNDNNSAVGSTKNGNLPLTSNPDSATVGSPGSYKASLTVASISGVPQAFLKYGDKIIYFVEASDRFGEEKNFANELLGNQDNLAIEFVRVPGIGTNADYANINVKGKIALVARGETTFEEKASIAELNGAAAVIVYNNVSGDIKMNVGEVKIPVASISQDDGEFLAELGTGTISLSKDQAAGPFMSDFSGWGPGPGLEIKPEITGHGGNITSAVPGEEYDTISGTSMATPNVAGVAALIRDYVKRELRDMVKDENGNESLKKVTEVVNRLLMSTADIVKNQNGLPYAVRKQGAGLASILKCSTTGAYILTYDRDDGSLMDRTKIELGDDPAKTGVYTLKLSIENFTDKVLIDDAGHTNPRTLSYNLSAIVMTEGVSETKTSHGDTTVTQESYILEGASVSIKSITGGSANGMTVTVAPGATATLEVVITLSDADKKYLNDSFENGMFVEGFIVLDSASEVDLSVPYLAFYGDWNRSPLFDLTYFDTHKDEIDKGLDLEDKAMADAYATRPIGGLYGEYLSYLGSYYYTQDPSKTQIAASADKVAISNQTDSVNELRSVWAGLLRNAKSVDIVIKEASTGKIVKQKVEKDGKIEWVDVRTEEEIRKSHGGGGTIRPATIDIDFSAIDHNLKNNTKYIVELKAYTDYTDGGSESNLNNTFTFPLYTDFEAPTLTNCEFYTEYDKTKKRNKLFVKFAVYDNHYSMAAHLGYVGTSDRDINGNGELDDAEFISFDRYTTPIYSEFNSVSYVTYELTDYISEIKENSYNPNAITIICNDYAMNTSTYEVALPDDYKDVYFIDEKDNKVTEISLNPNEIYPFRLATLPGTEWGELLEFVSTNPDVVSIVGNEIVVNGDAAGKETTIKVSDANGKKYSAELKITVLKEGDKGYKKIDPKPAKSFRLTGYKTNFAHYLMSSEDRDIGLTGSIMKFEGENYILEMYPSEQVTLQYILDSYYEGKTEVQFISNNENFVRVNEKGVVTAIAEGPTTINVNVLLDGKPTTLTKTITVNIKDPYATLGSQIQNYYGLGGVVNIGDAGLAVKEIGQFAFANYDYIPKTEEDEISEEDPYTSKIWYLGDNRIADNGIELANGLKVGMITEIIIPEGIEKIGQYAFAGLTELKKVTLPSTLKTIDVGAFYNCFKLETVEGIENVKFFNQKCFQNTNLKNSYETGKINLDNAIAIGDNAFSIEDTILEWDDNPNYGKGKFNVVYDRDDSTKDIPTPSDPKRVFEFSEKAQSIGAYAFAGNGQLTAVTIKADKIKLGEYAFKNCTQLSRFDINAAVISIGAFQNCTYLTEVKLGKDVGVIAENAFANSGVKKFIVDENNSHFVAKASGKYLVEKGNETKLMLVVSKYGSTFSNDTITQVNRGAFSGTNVQRITLSKVTYIDDYAFDGCSSLNSAAFSSDLTYIGNYAFRGANLTSFNFKTYTKLEAIGNYAFESAFTTNNTYGAITVEIPNGVKVGDHAFDNCQTIETVIIGNNVVLGEYAFNFTANGNTNVQVMPLPDYDYFDEKTSTTWKAWYASFVSPLTSLTIGDNVVIGNYAFANATRLTYVKMGEGVSIGDSAFLNAENLKSIDLSKVTSIGASAFSSYPYYIYITHPTYFSSGNIELDDETNTVRLVNKAGTQYEIKYISAPLANVDLSSLTFIGNGAFAYNDKLTTVTLGASLEEITYGAFGQCASLTTINLENVKTVGDYAFVTTALKDVNLSSATSVGEYAFFACNNLNTVTLNENGTDKIGNSAFQLCEALNTVNNLNKVKEFGDMAFANTAITNIDLTDATSVGRLAFMKNEATKVTLTLGKGITSMGDNPFAYCMIDAISTTVEEAFGDATYENTVYTFDLNDSITIIEGSIYANLPNGKLELITYCGNGGAVKVADTTSRVSDYAFAATKVTNVILPYDLMAIGHKAFFDCDKLAVVTFLGFNAPILEEEYDMTYATFDTLAFTGEIDLYGDGSYIAVGLGIVPYYMWSFSDPSNIYYGANFVDHIGLLNNNKTGDDDRIVMVRPVNGNYYDTFIYEQYFKTIIDGAASPDEVTLNAINLINALPGPKEITLNDKAQVEAARAAYNLIVTTTQQALVEKILPLLKEAEQRIATLEYLNNKPTTPDEPDTPDVNTDPVEEDKKLGAGAIIAIIIGSVIVAGGIGVGVYFLIPMLKAKKTENTPDSSDESEKTEEAAEEVSNENAENPSSEENS